MAEKELTPEELEKMRKKEARKDKLHQNYLKRKANGKQKKYEETHQSEEKAQMDEQKLEQKNQSEVEVMLFGVKINSTERRAAKKKNMTQRQLADILEISDKTISKWECGKGLPEVQFMIPLCNLLGINVNELLSGEKISANEYQQKAEENMMTLVKENEYVQTYKPLIGWIVSFTLIALLILMIFLLGSVVFSLPTSFDFIAFLIIVIVAALTTVPIKF